MGQIVFATGNKGKLREAQEILGQEFEVLSPCQVGVEGEAEETGSTLRENSLLKATYLHELRPSLLCFADDTGLEVDALDGAPGVYTARYAGPACDFDDNMDKLLRELEGVPMAKRTARFRCVVTLFAGDGRPQCFEGVLEGRIAMAKSGAEGFGYDPIFVADDYPDRTLAEVGEHLKNTISHRYKALSLMRRALEAPAENG